MKVKWDPTTDYYALLGLTGPSATLNDIKRAYRRMALKVMSMMRCDLGVEA